MTPRPPESPLRVLALTAFPAEAANTRFRLLQLLPHLKEAGIEVTVRPFVDSATWRTLYDRAEVTRTSLRLMKSAAQRVIDITRARHADVVLVLREAMLAGPPVVEILIGAVGKRPLVLDLDDATWVGYDSPTFGRLARILKWPGKTLTLIDRADLVTCGNRHVAEFVAARGRPSLLVPVVVDTDLFRPRAGAGEPAVPVIGWVGTHSSFPYLKAILPVLAEVARTRPFRLRVVGAGQEKVSIDGVEVENRAWDLATEAADFASLDIGLYPLPDDAWARGKSALKSVQYLACGVPFVASPVGAAAAIGCRGRTHMAAEDPSEWRLALFHLLDNPAARAEMGRQGRQYALEHHTTAIGAELLGQALRKAAG